jgi:hypothetical protein
VGFGGRRLVSHSDGNAHREYRTAPADREFAARVDWFWQHGAVVERDGMKQVFISGAAIGQFEIVGRATCCW